MKDQPTIPTSGGDGPVIVMSYFFAPSTEVGARRFTYLVAEWEKQQVEVRVVAAKLAEWENADVSLPDGGHVVRCPPDVRLPRPGPSLLSRAINRVAWSLLEPAGWEVFWVRPAVRAGLHCRSPVAPRVVVGTVPPRAGALAATRLATKLDCALILDYRDPWTAYPWSTDLTGIGRRAIAQRVERSCVARSQARVFNTPEMKDWFERYFPDVDTSANYVIPNGLSALPPAGDGLGPANDEIVHAGDVYMDRSLLPVLRALRSRLIEDPRGEPLKVVVYGAVPAWHDEAVQREGLADLISVRPRMPKANLDEVMRKARALIVVSGDGARYAIPGKMYDYLAIGRPILALATSGTALHRFVRETGTAAFADPNDIDGIGNALAAVLDRPVRSTVPAALREYLWDRLAQRYLQVIRQVSCADVSPSLARTVTT